MHTALCKVRESTKREAKKTYTHTHTQSHSVPPACSKAYKNQAKIYTAKLLTSDWSSVQFHIFTLHLYVKRQSR